MDKRLFSALCVFTLSLACQTFAQATPPGKAGAHNNKVCAACIRAHEEFLASDAMQGRGSGTHDELVAATYIASELRQYGIEPAGDHGSYIQRAPLIQEFLAQPVLPQGTTADRTAHVSGGVRYTWNAVGMLRGRDPVLRHSAVLLSAHLDHLGIGAPVNGDNIYHGADDDASGVAAVLELARVLGRGLRPRRTVIFAFFGSEETGGQGSSYFRDHPPLPLKDIVVNLEFEMIGRGDPAVKADELWLTGWERTNLGPALAAHGAKLVGDPHPGQKFFMRSDNYVLAKSGVVAQTISSYGLHRDYHQPSDDLAHLDFRHMDAAIGSLLGPIEWLVNSDFEPKWNEGGRP
jgi:hypothetical protein